jgi:hypothetical protein
MVNSRASSVAGAGTIAVNWPLAAKAAPVCSLCETANDLMRGLTFRGSKWPVARSGAGERGSGYPVVFSVPVASASRSTFSTENFEPWNR